MIYDLSGFTTVQHVADLGGMWYSISLAIGLCVLAVHILEYLYTKTQQEAYQPALRAGTVVGILLKYHVAVFLIMCLLKALMIHAGGTMYNDDVLFNISALMATVSAYTRV